MKCLRVSMYPPPGNVEPVTVVMRDIDMKVGPDYFVDENMSELGDGAFVITDVFEVEESEIVDATMVAIERQRERSDDENNMAILYYYYADQFRMLAPGGVISTTLPSPLSGEQIETTLLRLSNHPMYKRYQIIVHDDEFNPVTLRDGKIV